MHLQNLHQQAVEIAKRFHRAEIELIDILQKIDEHKVFMSLGYSSLFDYAIKALKLSEANASNFITVARKSKHVPELKSAIQAGDLTVSKARKITPVLTQSNSSHWIELAKTLPKPQLEKEVAKIIPQTLTPERAKYVTENRLELKLGVSEELMKKLRRAQDLVSQKSKKPANLEDTLNEILEIYLQRQDPVKKAERIKKDSNSVDDTPASVPGTHRYIPANVKHAVNLRDQGQCAHKDHQGQRCQNQRWLEIHHLVPVARNGTNDANNLITLCYNHHKQRHL